MKKLLLGLSLSLVVSSVAAGKDDRYPVRYETTALLDATSGFTRQAKLDIQVDAKCPEAHRSEMERVVGVLKKQGLNCASREEADFQLLVSTDTGSFNEPNGGHYLFKVKGRVFRLLDHGAKRDARSAWEGNVVGRKGTLPDWSKHLPPPYVEVDVLAEKFAASIGLEVCDPLRPSVASKAATMTVAHNVPVENLPKECVRAAPTDDAFNRLLREFFGSELIDIGKDPVEAAFVKAYRGESANGLYGKLKLRERAFHGTIHVSPMATGDEHIIVVAARIVEKFGAAKTLHTRYLHIRFSEADMLLGIDRGLSTKQEL